MKKKIIILLNVILLQSLSFGQCIDIELSIEWQEAKHLSPIAENGEKIPFLNIKYINTCDTAFYFQKIGNPNRLSYPALLSSLMFNYVEFPNRYEMAKIEKNEYSNEKFIVEISSFFDIKDSSQLNDIKYCSHIINYSILNVYIFLERIQYRKTSNDIEGWNINDFNDENINFYRNNENKIKDEGWIFNFNIEELVKYGDFIEKCYYNLIFLKPKSEYTETYNLVGFWYVGGNYLFEIEEIKDYFFTYPDYKKTLYKDFFPMNLNGYKLYEGNIIANEIYLEIQK